MSIWFTSDHHFGHKNIVAHCARPFSSVEEMDDKLIANWNSQVCKSDTVYHLGDFSLSDPKPYLDRLNGRVNLIIGNHDRTTKASLGQFVSAQDVLMFRHDGQEIWLSHYAHLRWPKSHHGVPHLFGHSHGQLNGSLPAGAMMFDVGVDCFDFKLWSLQEVLTKMAKIFLWRPPVLSNGVGR